ncbi:hypothetical protein [Vitiosangium sp. GDMCC 1.1324]|uniref:hypothetical protein n=1 Tax=Vitiosangium sp. (strain GDMCC 1.1324) TaxID=2138576 RepID=UPI001E5A9279|nr:hypothetical protein [Vitiosangium sp. GDMCC 1.1324]
MPLGLLALIAVGVHAAADTLDDRLLTLVDLVDAAFDRVVGRYSLTESLVDLLSLERRTTLARVLTLAWELSADVVLALPALGYREEEVSTQVRPRFSLHLPPRDTWRAMLGRCLLKPTTMRWIRPLATALVAVAGACTVARLVQGTVYLSWRELLGEGASDVAARGLALAALVGLLWRLGWRAVLRNLQHADAASEAHARGLARAFAYGLPGSALVAPLALAAALDASPLLSFVR